MSGCVLQVWDVYSQLATSWSQRLQTLQTEADAVLSAAPPVDSSHEQLAARRDDVQVRPGVIFSHIVQRDRNRKSSLLELLLNLTTPLLKLKYRF